MKVQGDAAQPPPPAPTPNPRDVGEGGPILNKDLVLTEQGASGSILNVDHADNTIVSFSGGPPGAEAEVVVNHGEVTSVDEYYDPGTGRTDSTLHFSDGDIITIRG